MSKFFCPGCLDNWDGNYTYFHTCATCSRPLRVVDDNTEEEENGTNTREHQTENRRDSDHS